MGGRGAASKRGVASSPKSSEAEARAAQAEKATWNIRLKALNWAKAQIGSDAYSTKKSNWPIDTTGYKCNQFVYHAFNNSNHQEIIVGPPINKWWDVGKFLGNRYPSVNEFYFGTVPGFKRVTKPKPGDICVDVYQGGRVRSFHGHIGIVSDAKGKTISASSDTNRVVENNWGFMEKNSKARFYRYVGKSPDQR